MADPIITRLSSYRFTVQYPGHEPLALDFGPLAAVAQALSPCRTFVLKHWQARPRGERRFGCFCLHADGSTSYTVHFEADLVRCPHYDLQVVPEIDTLPSAALYYPDALISRGVPYPWI